jgi:hypothetical protein
MARKRLVRKKGAVGLSLAGPTKPKRQRITNPSILAENAAIAKRKKAEKAGTGPVMKTKGLKAFLGLVDAEYKEKFYARWPSGQVDVNFFGYWDLLYLSRDELGPDVDETTIRYADIMGDDAGDLSRWERLKIKVLAEEAPTSTVPPEFLVYDSKQQPKEERKITNPMELTRNKAHDILMECEWVAADQNKKGCVLTYLRAEAVSSMVANMVRDDVMQPYQELSGDEKEYGLLIQSDWVQLLVAEIEQYAEEAKNQSKRSGKSRKKPTRLAKGFTPGQIEKALASFGYQKVDDTLGVSSVSPDQVFGAGMALLYNTKYRKITLLEAPPNSVLGLKGTSIIGFDASIAVEKTCKDPKKFLDWSTKPKIRKSVKVLKTKETKGNGRSNKETVILAVFK